jgi:hypothetical protein
VKSRHLPSIGILALVVLQACASAEVNVGSGEGGSSNPPGGGGGQGGGGGLILPDAATLVLPDAQTFSPDLPPCPTGYKQDKDGNYICCPTPLRILSIGQPAKYGSGSGDNTDAFQNFMNGNTNGTATMEMLKTYKHITDIDLSKYDVIILQALYTQIPYNPADLWTYNDADAAALRDWVKDKGGALISLSGYWSDQPLEIQPLNKLLSGSDQWTGISYNGDDTFNQDSCPDTLCYCSRGSIPFNKWQSTTDCSSITTNSDKSALGKVGVFRGRSVNCSGSGCNVFAKDSKNGNVGVAKLLGKGRVLGWGDEWVTYTSQWGLTPDPQYDSPTDMQCPGHTPSTSYSVPQFWYNVFRWLVPGNTCFTIIVPPTAPPGQTVIL